ncbi:MAG: NAD(P)-dependent oxidoreductase [Anaerolineae bacterium]|nr:NAD(P)-dependent oxidoreductase [Anaerolineae bacterium]
MMSPPETKPGKQPGVVLVTGGLGYLGSQLIRDLAAEPDFAGTTIRILDNLQNENYRALMNLPAGARYQFIEGDILDPAAVRLALREVEAVIHLAAIVRTPMSFERSAWVEQVNHWGTAHLVEACLEAGVAHLILASTTAVHGPGGPFRETDPCFPQGAYAQSKRQAEVAVLAAFERGLQTTILRFGLMYGLAPIVRFEAVPNRFAYLAGVGHPLTVFGTGEQRRSLIHIRDASQAVCLALRQPQLTSGHILNVIDQNSSVLELVEAIRQEKPEVVVRFTEQDIRTHLSFEVDNSAILALGWQPQVSVRVGLAEVVRQFQSLAPLAMQTLDFE